ncbi:MAG: hypothetical protein AB7I35_12890 [Ramlibacter sp.]
MKPDQLEVTPEEGASILNEQRATNAAFAADVSAQIVKELAAGGFALGPDLEGALAWRLLQLCNAQAEADIQKFMQNSGSRNVPLVH